MVAQVIAQNACFAFDVAYLLPPNHCFHMFTSMLKEETNPLFLSSKSSCSRLDRVHELHIVNMYCMVCSSCACTRYVWLCIKTEQNCSFTSPYITNCRNVSQTNRSLSNNYLLQLPFILANKTFSLQAFVYACGPKIINVFKLMFKNL